MKIPRPHYIHVMKWSDITATELFTLVATFVIYAYFNRFLCKSFTMSEGILQPSKDPNNVI